MMQKFIRWWRLHQLIQARERLIYYESQITYWQHLHTEGKPGCKPPWLCDNIARWYARGKVLEEKIKRLEKALS